MRRGRVAFLFAPERGKKVEPFSLFRREGSGAQGARRLRLSRLSGQARKKREGGLTMRKVKKFKAVKMERTAGNSSSGLQLTTKRMLSCWYPF